MTNEQWAFFEENGFLIVPNYLSEEEVEALRQRMTELLEKIELDHQSVFTTNQQTRTSDLYFLESGDKIRCFFEAEEAENTDKKLRINKVGHALHDLDEVFKKASYKKELLEIASRFGHQEPAIIQSQYIFKSPKVGGNVAPHTDSTFLYTEPLSCLGAWIALEDADRENACLWGLPKSHQDHPIYQRFHRNDTNDGTVFSDLEEQRTKWNLNDLVALEVKKGDMILLHGSNVHLSYANHSERSRHAYVLHLIDNQAHYPNDNWLQRMDLPLQTIKEGIESVMGEF